MIIDSCHMLEIKRFVDVTYEVKYSEKAGSHQSSNPGCLAYAVLCH